MLTKYKVTSFTAPWPPGINYRIVIFPEGVRWMQYRKSPYIFRMSLDRPILAPTAETKP